jgi:hypothetical protein
MNRRTVVPSKAVISHAIRRPTVLTLKPWTYVTLWLKRCGYEKAGCYWEQSHQFYRASIGLPLQSAPLLLYYSFLNATKALLSAKREEFIEWHGVKGTKESHSKVVLANQFAQLCNSGVAPSLAKYLGDSEATKIHSLKDLFFNLAFIHRCYVLTYASSREMFCPLEKSFFAFDGSKEEAFFYAVPSSSVDPKWLLRRLPPAFKVANKSDASIRSTESIQWRNPLASSPSELRDLTDPLLEHLVHLFSELQVPELLDRELVR